MVIAIESEIKLNSPHVRSEKGNQVILVLSLPASRNY